MLMATCCEDDVVPHVLPFVKDNISNPDWRHRDAAVMAFGKNEIWYMLIELFLYLFSNSKFKICPRQNAANYMACWIIWLILKKKKIWLVLKFVKYLSPDIVLWRLEHQIWNSNCLMAPGTSNMKLYKNKQKNKKQKNKTLRFSFWVRFCEIIYLFFFFLTKKFDLCNIDPGTWG